MLKLKKIFYEGTRVLKKMSFLGVFVAVIVLVVLGIALRIKSASKIKQVETETVKFLIAKYKDDIILLDVREKEEYRAGHIPKSVLIPLGELALRLNELDKQKAVLVICRSGNRSLRAAEILIKNGFNEVFNYKGGMLSWDGDIAFD